MSRESPGKRKTIFFNMDDPEQAKSFEFLETVRYQQSKFISKLIAEYRAKNHLTDDISYMQIKENVIRYLGSENTGPVISEKEEYAKDIADLVIERLLEDGFMIGNGQSHDANKSPSGQTESLENKQADVHDAQEDGLSDMLSGFSAMIDS